MKRALLGIGVGFLRIDEEGTFDSQTFVGIVSPIGLFRHPNLKEGVLEQPTTRMVYLRAVRYLNLDFYVVSCETNWVLGDTFGRRCSGDIA